MYVFSRNKSYICVSERECFVFNQNGFKGTYSLLNMLKRVWLQIIFSSINTQLLWQRSLTRNYDLKKNIYIYISLMVCFLRLLFSVLFDFIALVILCLYKNLFFTQNYLFTLFLSISIYMWHTGMWLLCQCVWLEGVQFLWRCRVWPTMSAAFQPPLWAEECPPDNKRHASPEICRTWKVGLWPVGMWAAALLRHMFIRAKVVASSVVSVECSRIVKAGLWTYQT